jgi:hypothetical protein
LVKLSPIPTSLEAKLERDFPVKAVLFDIYGTLLISGTGDISLAQEKENSFSLDKALDLAGISLTIIDGELSSRLTQEIRSFHGHSSLIPQPSSLIFWASSSASVITPLSRSSASLASSSAVETPATL